MRSDVSWDGVLESELCPLVTESEARDLLQLRRGAFLALCVSGRLVPERAEHGRPRYRRDDVLKIAVLLRRARGIAAARRVKRPELAARAETWAEHLRHEATLLKRRRDDSPEHLTLARAFEAAARMLEASVFIRSS